MAALTSAKYQESGINAKKIKLSKWPICGINNINNIAKYENSNESNENEK
jgi:hypothetical protein